MMICLSFSPFRRASLAQYSVGTKQRVTSVWNHVLWHVVKSVTTYDRQIVAKVVCPCGLVGTEQSVTFVWNLALWRFVNLVTT